MPHRIKQPPSILGPVSPNPYESPRQRTRRPPQVQPGRLTPWTAALLTIPFLLPVGVYLAYQPINASWTVHQFGCGCPPLDGSWRFNANHFNAILFALVGGLSICCWTTATGRALAQPVRWNVYLVGVAVVLVVTLKMLAKSVWL